MLNRRLWCVALAITLTVGMLCGCVPKEQTDPTNSLDNTSSPPEVEFVNQEKNPNAVAPKLTALTVDGGYAIEFVPDVFEYTVLIPEGRPRVPKIAAQCGEDAQMKVFQATIADGEGSGMAKVTVTKDGAVNTYTVKFAKDASLGFHLQYQDVYQLPLDGTLKAGESYTYESTDSSVLSVDNTGAVTAQQLSDEPVTVTVKNGDKTVQTLKVDRVVKAPLNVFLIMGQSNAYGWHDVPNGYSDYYAYAAVQQYLCQAPDKGTVWCDDIQNSYDEYTFSGMYDLSRGRSGFSPALGKQWYALTGEKTLMIQTAIGSSPIETWVRDPSLKFYGIDCYAATVERFDYYKEKLTAADSGFEMNRIYGFWLQGETCEEYVYSNDVFTWEHKNNVPDYQYVGDWRSPQSPSELMTAKTYKKYFLDMCQAFTEDVGLEFLGILPVRAMTSVSSRENIAEQQLVDLVAPRAAQFSLNFTGHDNISIVTLETEIGRTETYRNSKAKGWGYMGVNNIHYNQVGYNALGTSAAENTVAMFSAEADQTATDIRILDSNGRDTISNGGVLKVSKGEQHQITAIVLPLYSDATTLTFDIRDTSVCTVDEFGMLKITNSGEAVGKSTTLTISNGQIMKTFTILITK